MSETLYRLKPPVWEPSKENPDHCYSEFGSWGIWILSDAAGWRYEAQPLGREIGHVESREPLPTKEAAIERAIDSIGSRILTGFDPVTQ